MLRDVLVSMLDACEGIQGEGATGETVFEPHNLEPLSGRSRLHGTSLRCGERACHAGGFAWARGRGWRP